MAKLNRAMQKKTAEAEATSAFEPVPAGWYHLRLRDVDSTREPGPKGPYWVWEYESVEPRKDEDAPNTTGRRFWNNTSLGEKSLGFLKASFEAFGTDTDADTDDLCGQIVKGKISIRTIQAGSRKGELTNQIDQLVPADEDFELSTEAEAGAEEDSIF